MVIFHSYVSLPEGKCVIFEFGDDATRVRGGLCALRRHRRRDNDVQPNPCCCCLPDEINKYNQLGLSENRVYSQL